MKGTGTKTRIHGLQHFMLLVLLMISYPALSAEYNILIIKSSDNSFFNRSIESLTSNIPQSVNVEVITAKQFSESQQQALDQKLIVTLGAQAARLTLNHSSGSTPIIHGYIAEFQLDQQLLQPDHFIVLLDQPIQRYLRFINVLLPGRSVGLFNTIENKISASNLQNISSKAGISIQQQILQADDNPVKQVRNLLKQTDLLLGLPEPAIYNQHTLKGILLTAYRLGKPLISYSPSHVHSGALASIYTSPEQIGRQIARLIEQIRNKGSEQVLQIHYARDFEIVTNRQVAHSLNIELPPDKDVLQALHGEADK